MDAKGRGLVIIGNGVAGVSAAVVARRLIPDLRIRIISSESDWFFSRTALMYIYMGHMRLVDTMPYESGFFSRERLERVRGRVVDFDPDRRALRMADGQTLEYDALLLSTGSLPNQFDWPGRTLPGVQGFYSLQDLEALEKHTASGKSRAVIVGGGLIGIEVAEMLHTRRIPVTMLVREEGYWGNILPREESAVVEKEIERHHIDLRLTTELKEIRGTNGVTSVVTTTGEEIPCDLVVLSAGVAPNVSVLPSSGTLETGRGYLVDGHFRTSLPGVFAAGDCAQFRTHDGAAGRVEQLWYTARAQGELAGRTLAREFDPNLPHPPGYERGIWFNSAKFFTIEYQTYGMVSPRPPLEQTHVWQHPSEPKMIRLCWESDGKISGFNVLGIRFRQNVCEEWIRTGRHVDAVVEELSRANFDPEFFRRYEADVLRSYQERERAA